MTFDPATIENDPFLITMRQELNDLEKVKEAASKASDANPSDVKARIVYDASVILWARATNNYHNAIKAVLGL